MNRTTIRGGMSAVDYYAAMNTNYQKSYLGGNWFNVEEYGAVHDNSTDDTVAIQAAINACDAAGGGTVFFPNGIYKIAGALQNAVYYDGTHSINYNSQIIIPAAILSDNNHTVRLLGENPSAYVDAGTYSGTVFRSTIAGSGTWPSVICSMGPSIVANRPVNYNTLIIENIKVLVNPFVSTTGPSMCGVNVFWCNHPEIKKLTYGLDLAYSNWSTSILPTNHVFGLAIGMGNGDFPIVDYFQGSGAYYGAIIGEGVHVKDLFCFMNHIGIMSAVNPYGSIIDYAVLHWNSYDIAALQEAFYDLTPGRSNLTIGHMTSEDNNGYPASWCNRIDEILDTNNYLYGKMDYIIVGASGVGTDNNIIKSHGGNNFLIKNIGRLNNVHHWTTSERPTDPWYGTAGFNTTTSKMECFDGSQWNNLW